MSRPKVVCLHATDVPRLIHSLQEPHLFGCPRGRGVVDDDAAARAGEVLGDRRAQTAACSLFSDKIAVNIMRRTKKTSAGREENMVPDRATILWP